MIWLLFIFSFIILGILSWEKIFPNRNIIETFLIGSLFGMILSCVIPFLFGLTMPFQPATILSLTVSLMASTALIFLDWKNLGKRFIEIKSFLKTPKKSTLVLFFVFIFVLIPYLYLISKILFIDSAGWITTGFRSSYGDTPFHLTYINSFSFGNNFPPQNPDFSATPSNYPFLPFLTSSALVSLGANQITGFLAPLFVLGTIIIGLLFFVPLKITRNRLTAMLLPIIFLLSGGLGFLYFCHAHGFDIFSTVKMFPNVVIDEATNIPVNGINLMNTVVSSLLPQRGIFFGLPIFLAIILLWFMPTNRSIIASAILMASLPLLHAHTFIAISLILPFFLFYLWKTKHLVIGPWIWFLIIVFFSALPVLIFFHPDLGQSAGFVHLSFGWMNGKTNIIWYWIKNLGVFLLVLTAAFIPGIVPKELKLWYLPFLSLFFIANFIMFSPWDFDNHKFFNIWHLVSCFLVAYVLARLFKNRFVFSKILAGALLLTIILSGAIDFSRLFLFSQKGFRLFSPEAQELGIFLKENTPANSVFLSSTSHISPIVLSGRKRYVGYTGWLWSRGINYKNRLEEEKIMFAGKEDSASLMKEKGINYVLIGNQEFNEFYVNTPFFEETLKKIYDKNNFRVFSVN